MRILQIYDHIGINCGIMSVVMNWYRHIDREQIQFDFLVSHRMHPSYEEEILGLGGRVFYMSEDTCLRAAAIPRLTMNVKRFLRSHACQYQAVHLHTLTFAFPYLFYAKKYGVPLRICHAHSISLGNTRLKSVRNQLMILPIKTTANAFLSCSREAGVTNYGPLGITDVRVVLNGVDSSRYALGKTDGAAVRAELGIGEETFLTAHISNMTEIKNVPFALRVFEKIHQKRPDSKFLLVGKQELPEAVRKTIGELGLQDSVLSLGVRTDVPRLLQAVDVCLMPSRTEGFGLVAVECQLAGVPVITSLGFPEEVYVTALARKAELESDEWARQALEAGGLRSTSPADRKNLEKFDIGVITRQISNFYMAMGDL